MTIRIAVDAMGGDHAPRNIVEGAVQAVRENHCEVLLVGKESEILSELARLSATTERGISVVHASQVVAMDESVALALRQKKDSSIRVGARMVKEGRARALVSAGNTGVVMATSKILLGLVPGVDRPAVAVTAPAKGGKVVILDAGANMECKPHHFRQFAVMGYLYAQSVLGIKNPRVALLSIGQEDSKGTNVTREVFKVLRETQINFVGNIEGNDVYSGRVDVVVTDGFTGNVTLKVTESMVDALNHAVVRVIRGSYRARLGYLLMKPAIQQLRKSLDYAEYGGAPLLGARECVLICHGRSSPKAIKNAVRVAHEFVERRMSETIAQEIRSLTEAEIRLAG